ncbi:MAG: type II toxin-antitoxin system death-on-curing family toxin [Polaromonas sp.]|nr:type II toxin-antitoxin system death-on-curing family toxin [Polaromonas sp.]
MTWRWIAKYSLLLLHGESLAEHDGGVGLRDEGLLDYWITGLLDSTLGRSLNLLAGTDPANPPDFAAFAAFAASYTVGLAKNHPFLDGNKRAAFLATGLFLYLNGYRLYASQAEATITMLAVATGDVTESEFADWLRQHARLKADGHR